MGMRISRGVEAGFTGKSLAAAGGGCQAAGWSRLRETSMPNRELKPLRAVLGRAVAAARLSSRTVENALGLRRGGWTQILSGERILRVSHLLALARLLDVPPGDFLDLGLPKV